MGKERKTRISNSYFKAVRKWFGKKTRTTMPCLHSKVEQDARLTVSKDRSTHRAAEAVSTSCEKASLDLKQLLIKTVRSSESILPSGSGSQVSGEHPLVPSSSDHTPLPGNSNFFPRGSFSCPLLDRQPQEVRGSPDHRQSVLGSFSQADVPRKGQSNLDGTQCTSISFTALVMNAIFPVGLWTSETVDRVVGLGDRLHHHVIRQMGSTVPPSFYLAADDMPQRPEDGRYVWPVSCTKGMEYVGVVYPDNRDTKSVRTQLTWKLSEGHPFRDLEDALARSLQGETTGCVLTTECRSSAVIKSPTGEYMVVDSHAKDALGVTCPDGKATVLRFASVRDVVAYFKCKATGMTMYSLRGFKVDLELQNTGTPFTNK